MKEKKKKLTSRNYANRRLGVVTNENLLESHKAVAVVEAEAV